MKAHKSAVTSALSLALAAAAFAPQAVAQEGSGGGVEVGVELGGRYDSNVGNTSDARADLARVQGSDTILSPSLFMNINTSLGSWQVRGNAVAGYDFYTKNEELNSERLLAGLSAEGRLAFCTLTPAVSFRRQQNELGDRFVVDEEEIILDNVQTVQEYSLDAGCGQEIGLRVNGGVSYAEGDNSNVSRLTSDYESFTYRGGVGYHHPSVGELDLYVSQEETEYENRVLDGVTDEYKVRRYGASFERDIGARLKGRVEGFLIDLDAPGSGASDFNGTGWNFDLSATLGARISANIGLGRDVQPVLNNDALYMKRTNWGAGLSYAVNDRVTLNAAYSRVDRDYVYSDILPADPTNPLDDDSLDQFTGSLDFQGSGPFGFSVHGGYENRTSNDAFYDYDGFFAGVRLRYLFIR